MSDVGPEGNTITSFLVEQQQNKLEGEDSFLLFSLDFLVLPRFLCRGSESLNFGLMLRSGDSKASNSWGISFQRRCGINFRRPRTKKLALSQPN